MDGLQVFCCNVYDCTGLYVNSAEPSLGYKPSRLVRLHQNCPIIELALYCRFITKNFVGKNFRVG